MAAVTLPPFDGNAYRKRVLAAVDARGGPEQSDPFELYDLPVDDTLSDAEVAARMDAVWAFWQKQRDHPKYRGVVTAMLAIHRDIADDMSTTEGRRWLAERTRTERAARDEQRYAALDAALARLVQRFGGVPEDKVDGLRGLATVLSEAEFEARLRRHRLLPPSSSPPPAPDAAFRQVRDDLDELGQLDRTPAPAGLYDLLGLPPTASVDEVRTHRNRLAARNRERRPDRRRALVDDLLAAVSALLVDADPARYLDDLQRVVLDRLRPRVAAAVLVEDELTAQDLRHLLREAQAAGLDRDRALSVLAQLAGEFGVSIRSSGSTDPQPAARPSVAPRPDPSSPQARWTAALAEARAALREGRSRAAQAHVGRAEALAGGMLPPIRAVRDEVAAILAEADQSWRAALAATAGLRYVEAITALQRLVAIGRDVPGPQGQDAVVVLGTASGAVDAADRACADAEGLAGAARELALLDVLASVADHGPAGAALGAIGVQPARRVRAVAGPGGVTVHWAASPSVGPVDYRVLRLRPDGASRVVGVTRATSLEDGSTVAASGYVVIARRAGVASAEARTDRPDPAERSDPAEPGPTIDHLTVRPMGRRIRLIYPPPAEGVAEVRRLPAGVAAPPVGTRVDPDRCGRLVPSMGPGLAVDTRPSVPVTEYVVLTVGSADAVVGATAAYVDLPPVSDLRVEDGRLRWTWPAGCTEVLVVTRPDAPPESATDPAATSRKVTNTKYNIDGGVLFDAVGHGAVFSCIRIGGRLFVATETPAAARAA